jgi:hypothetical protein
MIKDSHPIEITVWERIYQEPSIVNGSDVVDKPKALTPLVKGQVIPTIH